MSEDAYETDDTGAGESPPQRSAGLADLARGALRAGRHAAAADDDRAPDLVGLDDVSIDDADDDYDEAEAGHVDNAETAQDDAAAEELEDGFDDDATFEDGLDDFMSEDPEEEDLVGLDDVDTLDDSELDEELGLEPKRGGKLSAAARRAIEERAEQRRMDRDLNYLDFELDD
ncbi:MAG: hypothetical protein AAF515_10700 [Pseudomonadota bacterium]